MKELETKYNNGSTHILCLLCGKVYELDQFLQQPCELDPIMSPFSQMRAKKHQEVKKLPQGQTVMKF